jgi:uncharacterized membrane protein YhaH (DUF805 family)
VLFIVIGLGIGILLGVSEHVVGGNIQEAQAILRERFSTIFGISLATKFALFGYALLNIMAKRIRHIGLPAWPVIVVVIVASGMAAQFAGYNVQQGLSTAELLALLLIPGSAFGQRRGYGHSD